MSYEEFEKAILRLGLYIHWYDESLDVMNGNVKIAKIWKHANNYTIYETINKLDPRDVSSVKTLSLGLAARNVRKR